MLTLKCTTFNFLYNSLLVNICARWWASFLGSNVPPHTTLLPYIPFIYLYPIPLYILKWDQKLLLRKTIFCFQTNKMSSFIESRTPLWFKLLLFLILFMEYAKTCLYINRVRQSDVHWFHIFILLARASRIKENYDLFVSKFLLYR